MARPKIVFVGAGSITFAPKLLVDFVHQRDLHGAELCLVDINGENLAKVEQLGRRLFDAAGADYTLTSTTERTEALPGADFVIVSVEVDRYPTWKNDYEIPARFGIEQALGENGGPGGLFHALRMIPPVVEICRDVERLCPDALVLNLTNPLSRICKGMDLYTDVNFVGLCHEIKFGREHLSHVLDLPEARIANVAAGLNHFTWFLDIRDAELGDDLYPAVHDAYPGKLTIERLLTAEIFRKTGVLCVTSDSHAGEYLPDGHVWRTEWWPDAEPLPFKFDLVAMAAEYYRWQMGFVLEGQTPPEEFMQEHSGEQVVDIISAAWHDRDQPFYAVNVPNAGFVSNLPAGAIVEVPGRVDRRGVHGCHVNGLPDPMAGWARPQCDIHELTARAAMEGDRRAALDALSIDPAIPPHAPLDACVDALLDAHRAYLPRFFG